MNKILVKAQRGKHCVIPNFSQCLLNLFENNRDEINLEVKLENNHLVLIEADKNCIEDGAGLCNAFSAVLYHSPECPIRELALKKNSPSNFKVPSSGIPVAISVILESADHHILLTRRSRHMRSSPGVWVPPGGHLESGEGLLEGGLREVFEETGLELRNEEITFQVLCLWENVFPIILGFGEPKSHALVVYYLVRTKETYYQLNANIKIDPEEVEAYAWLSPQVMAELFTPCDTETFPQVQYVWRDGKIVETELKYLEMFNRYTWTSGRVYSGVQCSLLKWYERYVATHIKSKI